MNIYLCTRTSRGGYDTYDSFICYANNEEEAKNLKPGFETELGEMIDWNDYYSLRSWVKSPDDIDVEFLGTKDSINTAYVILASFNAG